MRILSITAQKPHQTGSGTYLTELVRSFDRCGHAQGVVCGVYPDDVISLPAGVRVYPVYFRESCGNGALSGSEGRTDASAAAACLPDDAAGVPFPIAGMSDVMPYTSTRYCDLTEAMAKAFSDAFLAAVDRAVADLDPDIILCHHLFYLTSLVRERYPGRFIAGLCHGSDLRQMRNCLGAAESPYDSRSCLASIAADITRGVAELDAVFALHNGQREEILNLYAPVSPERVTVIGTGYNPEIFYRTAAADAPADDAAAGERLIRIIYAGKLCREKGTPELLQALEALATDGSGAPFEVRLAGGCKDPATRALLDAAWHYPIHYLGLLPQRALADEFRHSDVFVLPSYYEGLPLVLIEAMACGLRTICNDLPGVRAWLAGAIPGNNTRFVALPEMLGVDTPDPSSVPRYIARLAEALRSEASAAYTERTSLRNGSTPIRRTGPDTSGATWDAVASRVCNFYQKFTN